MYATPSLLRTVQDSLKTTFSSPQIVVCMCFLGKENTVLIQTNSYLFTHCKQDDGPNCMLNFFQD